jgi:hypothetical protein
MSLLDPIICTSLALIALLVAVTTHGAIDVIGALLGAASDDDSYATHAHAGVMPVLLIAVVGIFVFCLRSVAVRSAQQTHCDPLLLITKRLSRVGFALPLVVVLVGSFCTLTSMEFFEQYQAAGHITGVADALGGNPWVGLSILAVLSCAVTKSLGHMAGVLSEASARIAELVTTWLARLDGSDQCRSALGGARAQLEADIAYLARLANGRRCIGRRAPPQRTLPSTL